MSCGQLALERAGINTDRYYASEIDKYAIQVTQKNYPNTVQLGDIEDINFNGYIGNADLLIGGSPCQGFSRSGKGLNFDDPRSKLIFKYIEAKNIINPKYFLLENVVMKQEWVDIITELVGVEPIKINSSLVSAQIRERLYWTNIPNITLPTDKEIYFGDIREYDVADKFYYSPAALNWIKRHGERKKKKLRIWDDNTKVQMLEKSMHKKYSSQRFFGIPDTKGLRYITLTECERAQTVPDGYTSGVSDTQRYMMLGNGWTVDVIAHILSFIPDK
jgi:site-specific DNA-cytosine methylase